MIKISAETWKNSGVEVINDIDVNSIYFWLNGKHIETEIDIQIYQNIKKLDFN